MNKQLLELRNSREKKEGSVDYQPDADFFHNCKDTDEQELVISHDDSVNINISNFHNDDSQVDFEDYKKEVDKNTEDKKKRLEEMYSFKKTVKEIEIREKFEVRFQNMAKEEEDRMKEVSRKKKEDLRKTFSVRIEEYKGKIKEQMESNKLERTRTKQELLNSRGKELNSEIKLLERKLKEVTTPDDDYSKKYEIEVKKLETSFENTLKSHQENLEQNLNIKQSDILNVYLSKKIEFENSLKKSKFEDSSNNISSASASDSVLTEKKNNTLRTHQHKLENYRETLLSNFMLNLETDKEEAVRSLNSVLIHLKENYEFLKDFYLEQKLLFHTELNIISTSNMMNKLKNICESKNSIFKNLIEQNYFMLNKKIRELENTKELSCFTNKETVVMKIAELLTMLFYENIYEYLQFDLSSDKEVIVSSLDDLISKCERIISNLNCEKKVQLNMLICNPNFNFWS